MANYPFREGHRRRNIRPPAATDRALRGGLRERALLAPDCCPCYHPKCPTSTFGAKSITPNVHMTWTIVSDARKDGQIFLVSEDEFVGIG